MIRKLNEISQGFLCKGLGFEFSILQSPAPSSWLLNVSNGWSEL